MVKRIDKLTPEQQGQMDAWADRWIEVGLRTGPADRGKFEANAKRCYEAAGLKWHGNVVWVSSPLVMAIAAPVASLLIETSKGKPVRGAANDAVRVAVGDAANGAVNAAVGDAVDAAVRGAVSDAVNGAVNGAVDAAVRYTVDDAVRGAVGGAVGAAVDVAVSAAVGVAVGDAANGAVRGAVDDAVNGAVDAAVRDAVDAAVRGAVGGAVGAAVDVAVGVAVDVAVSAAVDAAVRGAVDVAVSDAVDVAVGVAVDVAVSDAANAAVRYTVDDAVRGAVGAAVRDAVDVAVSDAVDVAVSAAVGVAVGDAANGAVRGAVDDAVRVAVSDAVDAAVRYAVDAAVGGAVDDAQNNPARHAVADVISRSWMSYLGGQFWIGGWYWGPAYTSFFREVCGLELSGDLWERGKAYEAIAEAACYWYPHRDFIMVCERPLFIHQEQSNPDNARGWGSHRLHAENGPAIAWPDGWGLYVDHGVRMPFDIGYDRSKLTVARIDAEKNAEVRRVMLKWFGVERYIRDGNAKVVHADNDPLGNPRRLLRRDLDGDEPIVMVEVTDSTPQPSGEFKKYMLRVDPNAYGGKAGRECHAAIASTWRHKADPSKLFFATPKAYAPTVET